MCSKAACGRSPRASYYQNFEAPYQGGWASLKPVTGNWQTAVAKEFPPDAPAPKQYQPFPTVFVPPYHYATAT